MVAETGMVKPTNKIVADSTNLHQQTKKVETATSMYPGRLVMRGTNDDDIVVCTAAGAALGWLGYEHTAKADRPASPTTIYVVDKYATVVNGPGILVVGNLVSGQTIVKDARLMAGAAGELSGGTVGTHEIVAIAEESVTATTAVSTHRILVRSLI